MFAIHARNVNDAFDTAIELVNTQGIREETRNGQALVLQGPVLTVYERPWERVLFDESRDANPFFHLFESLWMLAGRNDAKTLDRYIKDFGARYAEPDGNVHGAYGRRWRNHFGMDQLGAIVDLLTRNPDDRQAVLQMWDATADLGVPGLKDRPCNTQAYFRVRRLPSEINYTAETEKFRGIPDRVLDLTVTCRSNDVVWGAYGANAVHFSVLQEYVAARIGVPIGTYYQFSNNWHGYTSSLEKIYRHTIARKNPYANWDVEGHSRLNRQPMHPMFMLPEHIDADLDRWHSSDNPAGYNYANPWFQYTAVPMWMTHDAWRRGDYKLAYYVSDNIEALDWRKAAKQWVSRREAKAMEKAQ